MLDGLLPEVVAQLAALAELPAHLVLCTDDLFAATLLSDGGVDHLVRRLVAYGMPRCERYGPGHTMPPIGSGGPTSGWSPPVGWPTS